MKALREWLRIAYAQGRKVERLGLLAKEGKITPDEAWEELMKPIAPEVVEYQGSLVARIQ